MTVTEIEQAIQKLDRDELSKFSHWIGEYVAAAWDKYLKRTSPLESWTSSLLTHLKSTGRAGPSHCEIRPDERVALI